MKKKILIAVLFTVLALVVATIALQLTADPVFYLEDLPKLCECYEPDSLLCHRLKPNLKGYYVKGVMGGNPVDFRVTTNSIGLRSAEVSPHKGRYRILVLGDSCTFGLGVENEESYPAQLEKRLNDGADRERRFEVINAGVPAYASWQGARYLPERGMTLDPDLVIVCYGNNDIAPGDDPNFVNQLPNVLHGGWLQEKLLHLAAYRIGLAAHVAQLNAQRAPRSGKESPSIEVAYRANLLEMSRAAKQHKTSLMFMVWPLLPQVFELQNRPVPHAVLQRCKSRIRMQSVMREVAASQGITVVDPLPALAASPEHPTYLAMIHANEKGLATIAGVLKQAVLEHVRKRHRPATP